MGETALSLGVVIDGLLVALMIGLSVGLVLLHRRIARLRAEQQLFAELVARLEAAAGQTRAALDAFKKEAENLADIEQRLAEARALKDELTLVTQAGEALADRLTRLASTARRTVESRKARTHIPAAAETNLPSTDDDRVVVLEALKSLR